jgi:hypothetical protein
MFKNFIHEAAALLVPIEANYPPSIFENHSPPILLAISCKLVSNKSISLS